MFRPRIRPSSGQGQTFSVTVSKLYPTPAISLGYTSAGVGGVTKQLRSAQTKNINQKTKAQTVRKYQ